MVFLAAAVLFAQADGEVAATLKTAPAPVRRLVERRMACNHWAGEEPYDRARAREIAAATRLLGCDRLDRDVAVLRRRYAARAGVLALLDRSADSLE